MAKQLEELERASKPAQEEIAKGLDQQKEIFELFPELMNSDGRRAYSLERQSLKKHEAKLLFNAE